MLQTQITDLNNSVPEKDLLNEIPGNIIFFTFKLEVV